MGDANSVEQVDTETKGNRSDSDIPVVSVSELLEENADVFAPMENLAEISGVVPEKSTPQADAVPVDSDDEIQFVENENPLPDEDINNLLKSEAVEEPMDTEVCNDSIDISELIPMVGMVDKVTIEKDKTAEAANLNQETTSKTDVSKPSLDVVILSDDDDEPEKTDSKQNIEMVDDGGADAAAPDGSESNINSNSKVENATSMAERNLSEIVENLIERIITDENAEPMAVKESSPSAEIVEDDDVIMLDDDSPEPTPRPIAIDTKGLEFSLFSFKRIA